MMKEIERFMLSADVSLNYRIVNLGGNKLYVEGIKSVLGIDNKEVKMQLKKEVLTITGQDLKIKYLDKTTCVIDGFVKAVVTE